MLEKTMTDEEIRSILKEKLGSAGLLPFVDAPLGQFLDFPEGPFVEIVLKDASKLPEAESAIEEVNAGLKKAGLRLDSVVRALWQVERTELMGPSRSLSGSVKAALDFRVTLRSGGAECDVVVELTLAALDILRERLGIECVGVGWSSTGDDVSLDSLHTAAREFVELQLSHGGTSYWDPQRFPRLELNSAAMSYLLQETPSFKLLRAAIDDFFDEHSIRRSLEDLRTRKVNIRHLQQVLPELSNHFAGAFKPGERFAVNAWSYYHSLDDEEASVWSATTSAGQITSHKA